jgi:hypothetical protein
MPEIGLVLPEFTFKRFLLRIVFAGIFLQIAVKECHTPTFKATLRF